MQHQHEDAAKKRAKKLIHIAFQFIGIFGLATTYGERTGTRTRSTEPTLFGAEK